MYLYLSFIHQHEYALNFWDKMAEKITDDKFKCNSLIKIC